MEVSECLLSLKQKQQVDTIAEQQNSVSTVIVDYRGLTVAEVTELRSHYVKQVLSIKYTKHYGSSCC